MPWLDRIDERDTRRLARNLQRNAVQAGGVAQDHLRQFGRQAQDIATHTARQVNDYGRHEGADLAREAVQHFGHRAGNLADHYAHRAQDIAGHVAGYGLAEGEVLAREAGRQLARAGRAVKADPMPVVIGAIGIALFASLLLGRGTSRRG